LTIAGCLRYLSAASPMGIDLRREGAVFVLTMGNGENRSTVRS
jgi:hypothetical protein